MLAQFLRDGGIVMITHTALVILATISLVVVANKDRQNTVGKYEHKNNIFNNPNTVKKKDSRTLHEVLQDDNKIEIYDIAEKRSIESGNNEGRCAKAQLNLVNMEAEKEISITRIMEIQT